MRSSSPGSAEAVAGAGPAGPEAEHTALWERTLAEHLNPHEAHCHEVLAVHADVHTRVQRVQVVELGVYGKALVLDGRIQSTENDEYVYHEALLYPAYCLHAAPRSVLSIGGANGAIAREVLKYPELASLALVDVDPEAMELCRRVLPHMHPGSYDDPRVRFHFGSARGFLAESAERYDVIYNDLPDAFEDNPTALLFTAEYYGLLRSRLNAGGLIVTHAGPASHVNGQFLVSVMATLGRVFRRAVPYAIGVPSLGTAWTFVVAGDDLPEADLPAAQVDARLAALLGAAPRSYDGVTHRHMFALPKPLRQLLEQPSAAIHDGALRGQF
jgi:spermidine synthase